MKEEELQALISKYMDGTASPSEREKLDQWYRQQNERDVVWSMDQPGEEQHVEKQMLAAIHSHIGRDKGKTAILPRKRSAYRPMYAAAAVLALCCLISGYYFYHTGAVVPGSLTVSVTVPGKTDENRFVLLPDSSTVILHPGSSIRYAKVGHERRLMLDGEAYFDIRHLASQPFVITTGTVKTTVLGTAFNIRAYKGQDVTVSVTRGKVSVLNTTTKAIAILLPDQQAVLSMRHKKLNLKPVQAQQLSKWTDADMQFEEMPFKELAARLSRRYNSEIRFKNPEMEKCLITGRFTGTEKLDQVLNVIALTMGATYKTDGSVVILDGTACAN